MKTAWICAPTFPEIDRDSGSRRILHTAQILVELGFHTSFLAKSKGHIEHTQMLEQCSVQVLSGSLHTALENKNRPNPDLVVISYWHLAEAWMPHIRRVMPQTKIVVDSLDLHFLRLTRKAYQEESNKAALLDPERGFDYIRELNTYAAADAVWTVSKREADLLNSLMGYLGLAAAVPDCEDLPASDIPYNERRGILFIGNFRHDPNRSAVDYLCRRIVPLIDRELLREHPVIIVGNALDSSISKLADNLEGVQIIGWTPSILHYIHKCRISILPLLYGAGTKRKLIQSLMCGTPAVSTWIGVEGLNLKAGEHVLVADDPREFANCVTKLLVNASLWQNIARRGRARVLRNHSRKTITARIESEIERLRRLPVKRADVTIAAETLRKNWIKPQYQQVLERINRAVLNNTPENSVLLVVSKGDEQLLLFPKRQGAHFPSDESGDYMGYHPPDSEWCIRKIESVDTTRSTYFVVPAPFLWWLAHYEGFREYLFGRFQLIYDDRETCLIFRLAKA